MSVLSDKSIGRLRAQLQKLEIPLSGGTTTLRWRVETYATGNGAAADSGALEEFTKLAEARACYRDLQRS